MKLLDSAGVSTLWGKVKDHVKTSIDSQQFKTINGTSVKGTGDIHIDLTLYKVVSDLPVRDIDTTKIYLVKDSSVVGNLYSEYMYVDEKWEKIGDFRSTVDLANYTKKSDAVKDVSISTYGSTTERVLKITKADGAIESVNIPDVSAEGSGFMSVIDKRKLDGIASNANNYSLPTASSTTKGGITLGYSQSGKNYPVVLDSTGKAYVNVPWIDTNTTYDLATSTKNGLMSAVDKAKLDSITTITDTELKTILV